MIDSVGHRVVLEWHLVQFTEILLDLVLAEEVIATEAHLVGGERHGCSCQSHGVTDEFLRLSRFLETRCDGWFDTLGAEILLEVKSALVVINKFVEVLLTGLHWGLKVAHFLGIQVANLHGVPHLEVDLVRVEAISFHCLFLSY